MAADANDRKDPRTRGAGARGPQAALFDAHCHLGWFRDPVLAADDARARGVSLLAVTVEPAEAARLGRALSGRGDVLVGAGLHPWWVADGRAGAREVEEACELARTLRLVGETGLDFSARRAPDERSRRVQAEAFARVCRAAAETDCGEGPRVMSIHAVRSASAVLDALEKTGAAARCRCVLHWFSGTSEELARAVRMGCWFSFGERALATRRGRAYAGSVPAGRLLTETDLPDSPGRPGGAEALASSLERALAGLAGARGTDVAEARGLVLSNARRLLEA